MLPSFFRSLSRAPGLSLMVVGTVAAGVAALTVAFGMADAAILRAPPFADVDRVAMVYTTHASRTQGRFNSRWSYPRIRVLRDRARSFSAVANYTGPVRLTLTGEDVADPVFGEIVSPSYFAVLGAAPVLGRGFRDVDDHVVGSQPSVVVGHRLWMQRFKGDSAILGRTIRINRASLTVVGVMPPGFRGLTDKAELWVPTSMAPLLTYPEYFTTNQNFISVVARLAPEASMTSADAEMRALGPRIHEMVPGDDDPEDRPSATIVTLNDARSHPVVRRGVLLLLVGVGLLHVLACANATSLLLGRAMARRHEAAVRRALGGTPRRLFLHYFAESAVVVLAGGVVGMVLAVWLNALMPAPADLWAPRNFYGSLAAFADPAFSWRVLAFAATLTVSSALVIASVPAMSLVRVPMQAWLRDGSRGAAAATSRRRWSAHGVIVVLETALAVVLLVAGALMIDSYRRMRATQLGVDDAHVLTFALQPPEQQVPTAAAPAFVARMLDAITAVPGVVSATVDGGAPVSGTARSRLFIMGREWANPREAPPVLRHYVAPAHFSTLGIPLVRGRAFTSQDIAGRPRVTVISESAARAFWPDTDPIGQRVWFSAGSSNFDSPDASAEIIGIVRDVMYEPLDVGPNRHSFYTPFMQFTYGWRIYFVRAAGDPMALIPELRRAIHALEPDLALTEVKSLHELIGASWSRQRFDARFFGGIGALALVLAISGIYSVVAYAVGRRTREMGIRMALGGQPRDIMRLVVTDGMVAPLVGVVVGTIAAIAATRLLRASLYGVSPTDPRVLGVTLAGLLVAAAIACVIPARRATRVDPCEALRSD